MKKASSIAIFRDCQGIGVDVSKAELVVVGIKSGESYIKRLNNERKAIKLFVRSLSKSGYQGRIICESTGHYHLNLAVICHEYGLRLIVLNPLQSSKHSKARIRKTKTDPEDGRVLATMCLTEPKLPNPSKLTLNKTLIRLTMGQLASLEKQIQQQRQSLRQYEDTYAALGLKLGAAQQALRAHCDELVRLKKRFQKELDELLLQEVDEELIQCLTAIPGFSMTVSGLVSQFDRNVKSGDSWAAYIGLDVSIQESGTWKGRGKLTKRGNAYLRKRLYLAAWGACMNYDYVRAYYDRLKSQGRKHVEAVCIIARKLLRIAFQVVTKRVQFDQKIAFAD
jgi:transposase